MNFSEKLKDLMTKRRLSQEDIASRLDVGQSTVSRWTRGSAYPDLGQTVSLAEMLEVNIEYLAMDSITEPNASELTWQERAVVEIYRARVKAEGAEVMTPAEVAWRIEVPREVYLGKHQPAE